MSLFDDIPDDPELAFLELEKRFSQELARTLNESFGDSDSTEDYLRYMSRTLAAKQALGLSVLGDWSVPAAPNFSIDLYRNFRSDVEHYRTTFEIRHSRRNKGLTVRFDATAKAKLRHYLTQIREIVDKLEVDDWKREDIYRAIQALELEIDRARSRLGVVGDFFVKVGAIVGETAEKAEPARKWIDSIARVIWGAQIAERTETLPRPERKELPAPPRRISTSKRQAPAAQLERKDDEIPF